MLSTTAEDLRIADDDTGHGEPTLLCLPGWCDSRAVFQHLTPVLSRDCRVIALDWRGHGASDMPRHDFTADDLVTDALAVIERSGARQVVPVTVSHAGWVGIELRRRLGAERVPRLALLDWIVLDPPPPFLGALDALQDPQRWRAARDQLFSMWLGGTDHPEVGPHLRDRMGAHGAGMWARAGREIGRAYARWGSPLKALAAFDPPISVLHLYSQPRDDGYLAVQQTFAEANPWFRVQRLDAATHFPTLETPDSVATAIIDFIRRAEVPVVAPE